MAPRLSSPRNLAGRAMRPLSSIECWYSPMNIILLTTYPHFSPQCLYYTPLLPTSSIACKGLIVNNLFTSPTNYQPEADWTILWMEPLAGENACPPLAGIYE